MRRLSLALVLLLTAAPAGAMDLFVTTTTFEISGSSSTLSGGAPFGVDMDLYTIHADAVARSWGSTVFVVNRFLGDNILVLDAADGYAVVHQYSTGNGSNPQDIAVVSPTKAYVTRYEKTKLWIVHPTTGTQWGDIDLGMFADGDGVPEMGQMAVVGDRLFVALQNLDRGDGFRPSGQSKVVVIDITTDTVIDVDPGLPGVNAISLPMQNPQWEMKYSPALDRILMVCPGGFLAEDGGLGALNPFDYQGSVVLTESELGGDLLAAVVVSPTLGYALRGDTSYNTCLVPFDPSQGTAGPPVHCTTGFHLSDLAVFDGKLFVGDRTPSNPGVRVYQTGTHALLAGPIDVGLPPFDLEPVLTSPVATPPVVVQQLRAWPNPSARATSFHWQTAHGQSQPLRVFNARGQVVRELAASPDADGWLYRWDGRDDTGDRVAAGLYVARVAGQAVRTLRLN